MKFIPLLIVAFLLGCSSPEDEKVTVPENLIEREKFVKVLADFSLAESAHVINPKNLSGAKFDSAYIFNPLKENNISQGSRQQGPGRHIKKNFLQFAA